MCQHAGLEYVFEVSNIISSNDACQLYRTQYIISVVRMPSHSLRGPSLQQSSGKGTLRAGSANGALLTHSSSSACRTGGFSGCFVLVVLFSDVSVRERNAQSIEVWISFIKLDMIAFIYHPLINSSELYNNKKPKHFFLAASEWENYCFIPCKYLVALCHKYLLFSYFWCWFSCPQQPCMEFARFATVFWA